MMEKKKSNIVKIAVIGVVLAVIVKAVMLFSIYVYNKFIDEAHLMHIAHGRVIVEQHRRYDLVNRSISIVRDYNNIEGQLVTNLVELSGLIRSGADMSKQMKTRDEVIRLITAMTYMKESYPILRSSDPYLDLIKTIQQSGARVTKERHIFNERVYEYNMLVRQFPYNVFSVLFGYRLEPFFKSEEGAEKVPVFKELM